MTTISLLSRRNTVGHALEHAKHVGVITNFYRTTTGYHVSIAGASATTFTLKEVECFVLGLKAASADLRTSLANPGGFLNDLLYGT